MEESRQNQKPHFDIQVQNVQAVNVTEAFQDLLDE